MVKILVERPLLSPKSGWCADTDMDLWWNDLREPEEDRLDSLSFPVVDTGIKGFRYKTSVVVSHLFI